MAVTVTTNRHGYLVLRIGWQCRREWLGLKSKYDGERGENTRAARRAAVLVEEELHRGRPIHEGLVAVFGRAPERFVPDSKRCANADLTVGVVAEEWYENLKAKRRRASLLEKAELAEQRGLIEGRRSTGTDG